MGDILLSTKEARRLSVMESLVAGQISTTDASSLLSLSTRQVLRMKARFIEAGAKSLAHGSRGRPSPRQVDPAIRAKVVELAADRYRATGYAHLSELLAQTENIHLSSKTVGRILKAALVPPVNSKRCPKKYRRRQRKERAGMLVQTDASPHDWLETGCSFQALHGIVDDATGLLLGLYMTENECEVGYLKVLGQMVRRFGVPGQIYTDRHTIFVSPKKDKLTIEEELSGKLVRLTQFGRTVADLGIAHVLAGSPQAKGRIERVWGTLQQRLPVELRIREIKTISAANEYLYDFCQSYNTKFAVEPVDSNPAWREKPSRLDDIISIHHQRKCCNGSTISFEGTSYQLVADGRVAALKPGSTVLVRVNLDGRKSAEVAGRQFSLTTFQANPNQNPKPGEKTRATAAPTKPAANHPWRRQRRTDTKDREG